MLTPNIKNPKPVWYKGPGWYGHSSTGESAGPFNTPCDVYLHFINPKCATFRLDIKWECDGTINTGLAGPITDFTKN